MNRSSTPNPQPKSFDVIIVAMKRFHKVAICSVVLPIGLICVTPMVSSPSECYSTSSDVSGGCLFGSGHWLTFPVYDLVALNVIDKPNTESFANHETLVSGLQNTDNVLIITALMVASIAFTRRFTY
jgi:hypothetical protein